MDKAGVHALFVAEGLSHLTKDIDCIAKVSIRLSTVPVEESRLNSGVSKMGGLPDLPSEAVWPEWKSVPQSFIAQIRLDDMQRYDSDGLLPQKGMLWFFYDAQQQTYGADPADRGGWSILYKEDVIGLQRRQVPANLPTTGQFRPCALSFASEISLSSVPRIDVPNFDWTDAEQKQYEKLLSTFPDAADHATAHNRLLGFPDTIQDDMRMQCQLVSHGVTDETDPRAAALTKGAMDWLLLLQVDSDDTAGMQWADAGMLYYWITRSDLQALRFDGSWLVLQSD
jgi:uncharacterized protein YwqG